MTAQGSLQPLWIWLQTCLSTRPPAVNRLTDRPRFAWPLSMPQASLLLSSLPSMGPVRCISAGLTPGIKTQFSLLSLGASRLFCTINRSPYASALTSVYCTDGRPSYLMTIPRLGSITIHSIMWYILLNGRIDHQGHVLYQTRKQHQY